MAVDVAGNELAASDFQVRRFSPSGTVLAAYGLAGYPGAADGPVATARFGDVGGLAVDAAGKLRSAGIALGSPGSLYQPIGLALDADGTLCTVLGSALLAAVGKWFF